jgi:hypothetical protein
MKKRAKNLLEDRTPVAAWFILILFVMILAVLMWG